MKFRPIESAPLTIFRADHPSGYSVDYFQAFDSWRVSLAKTNGTLGDGSVGHTAESREHAESFAAQIYDAITSGEIIPGNLIKPWNKA